MGPSDKQRRTVGGSGPKGPCTMSTPRRRSARVSNVASTPNSNAGSLKEPLPPNVYLFIPNLIGYSRVVLCVVALWALPTSPYVFFWSYAASSLLDAVDGYAARVFQQATKFGAVLDMVTDRAATTCLIAYIATLHPYYMLPAQFLIALDLSSHYMHMVATLSAGSASHKAIGAEGNRWLRLYYENKYVLFLVCFGNESFFILFYMLQSIPAGFVYNMFYVATWVFLPVCVLKQFLNGVQLAAAASALARSDAEEWIQQRKGEEVDVG